MTAIRCVTLKCDHCNVSTYYDGRTTYVRLARLRASARGWTVRRVPYGGGMQPRDICPDCTARPSRVRTDPDGTRRIRAGE